MTSLAGLPLAARVASRTSWKPLAAWTVGLTAGLAGTVFAIDHTYDTPEKIAEYARAVRSGNALVAINGLVAGVDTLGGVVANEFGFVAAFALPLMGISIVAQLTRREEESGRLDQLAAGRVGRGAPLAAAFVLALGAVVLTSAAFALCLVLVGIPTGPALLYACSLGALSLVFAAVAGVAAQGARRARSVYAAGLGVLAAAYLVRGVGDVEQSWVTWLSPLGWAEKTRSFGDPRWWPLVLPLAASVTGAGVALVVAARRDVGSSWGRAGRGPTSATPGLLRPAARSLRTGRGAVVTWSAGAALVAGMFGALSRQAAEALQGSPEARAALGGAGLSGADVLVRLNLVLLSLLVAAFAVQWVGGIREEETSGRLEVVLAGRVSRSRWLGAQVAALLVGVLAVAVAGGLALALSTAWSLDDAAQVPRLLRAAAAQLPVALVLAGAAFAVFGLRPRLQGLAWLLFAGTAAVALLGEPLGLPDWVRRLSPTEHVGSLPVGRLDAAGVVGVCAVALLLAAVGWAGFRRRDVPRG